MKHLGAHLLALLLLLLRPILSLSASNTTALYVGALYPIFSAAKFKDTPQGALIALEEINKDENLLPNYRLEMVKDITAMNRCVYCRVVECSNALAYSNALAFSKHQMLSLALCWTLSSSSALILIYSHPRLLSS